MDPVVACFQRVKASDSRGLCYQEFISGFLGLKIPMLQEVVVDFSGHGTYQWVTFWYKQSSLRRPRRPSVHFPRFWQPLKALGAGRQVLPWEEGDDGFKLARHKVTLAAEAAFIHMNM